MSGINVIIDRTKKIRRIVMKLSKSITIVSAIVLLVSLFMINRAIAFLVLITGILAMLYPKLMTMLGNIYYSKDQLDKSEAYFRRVYKCFYASLKHKLSYSYILILKGELDEAEKVLEKLSKQKTLKDEIINLRLNQSLIYWKRNQLDAAIDLLLSTYKDYKTMIIYQNLGYFLILKGDYNRALEFNQEAYEYDNDNIGILDNLAENYFFVGEYDKAIEIFDKIIHRKPSFASPYYYYALTLHKIGKKEEALEMLKKGLECKFSYLSAVKKDEIEAKILELND